MEFVYIGIGAVVFAFIVYKVFFGRKKYDKPKV